MIPHPSKSKDILKSIGEKLKDAREKKGLSIEEVQRQIRIHHNVLIDLEEGSAETSLSRPYIRSFLKKYSALLGLNSEEFLKDYVDLVTPPTEQHLELNKVDSLAKTKDLFLVFGPRVLGAVFLVILLVTLIPFAGRMVKSMKARSIKARLVKRTSPKAVIARAKNAASPKSRPAAVPKQTKPRASRSTRSISIPKGEPLLLVIRVRRKVLLELRQDGNILFRHFLPAGTEESIRADKKIGISVGDASRIELTLNGIEIGPLGTGPIRDLELTHQGLKIVKK